MTALDTPYFRTVVTGPISQGSCTPAQDSNYRPFDVFCLNTRLSILVNESHPTWSVNFRTLLSDDGKSMNLKAYFREETQPIEENIQIMDQDTETALYGPYVTLNEQEKTFYQTKINEYTRAGLYIPEDTDRAGLRPCGLFAPWTPIYTKDQRQVPSSWVASVLKYVPLVYIIPENLVEKSLKVYNIHRLPNGNYFNIVQGQLADGQLLVYLQEKLYEDHYHALHVSLTDNLVRWYERGYIVASDEFAEKWLLRRYLKSPKQNSPISPEEVLKIAEIQIQKENEQQDIQSIYDIYRYLENERGERSLQINEPSLYGASWTSPQYGQTTEFLISRRDNKPYFFETPQSSYDAIARYLTAQETSFYFSESGVWFSSDSYSKFAETFARLEELRYSNNLVSTKFALFNEGQKDDSSIVYYTTRVVEPWCVSTLV